MQSLTLGRITQIQIKCKKERERKKEIFSSILSVGDVHDYDTNDVDDADADADDGIK